MKILLIILTLIIGISFGISAYYFSSIPFEKLSLREMQKQVVAYQDFGIEKAIAQGIYNCCVEPACTMCFMQGNQWNHGEAGTCACAELIAQGKEPCPQCHRALSKSEDQTCLIEQECQEE